MKNTADMREFLLARMTGLASGNESVSQSNAMAALAKQVNATLAMDLHATRLLLRESEVKPLSLK